MRTITKMGDENWNHEDIAPELYRRSDTQPKKPEFGVPAQLGPRPTIEEINKPPKEQPKRKRPAKAKRDQTIEDAHTQDLKTRGIK